MDRDTELSLVEGLRHGDPGAFDAVYEAYRARVFGFLVRLSRSRTVAEDLLDETWLRLVSTARSLRADTHLLPWLFTVARNLYWTYRRAGLLEETVDAHSRPRSSGRLVRGLPDRGRATRGGNLQTVTAIVVLGEGGDI